MKVLNGKLLLSFILLISFLNSFAQKNEFRIVEYGKEDGLHNTEVYDIVKDDLGFMWLATAKGLERFDGSSFEYFIDDSNLLMTLKGKNFLSLFKDSHGYIWVGTLRNGVNVINPKSNNIWHYSFDNTDSTSLSTGKIKCIFEDNNNNVWVCSTGSGLNRFNRKDSTFTRVKTYSNTKEMKKYNSFQLNYQKAKADRNDTDIVWIATGRGLCKFNTKTFDSKYYFPEKEKSGYDIFFLDLVIDDNNDIWLSSWAAGLFKFDKKTESFENIKCNYDNNISRYSTCLNIQGITEFDNDNLLLLTRKKGLWIYNKKDLSFRQPRERLDHKLLRGCYLDNKNNLWISTGQFGDGFYCLKRNDLFKKIHLKGNILKIIKHPYLNEQYAINSRGILYILDSTNNIINKYSINNPRMPNFHGFMDMAFDKNANLWVLGRNDLFYLDKTKDKLRKVLWNAWKKKRDGFGYYWSMVFDKNNKLWVSAQSGGIAEIDIIKKTVQLYNYEEGNPYSLKNNYSIGSFYLDSLNNIWGWGHGAFYYSNKEKHFINYPTNLKASDGKMPLSETGKFVSLNKEKMLIASMINRIGTVNLKDTIDKTWQIIDMDLKLPTVRVNSVVKDKEDNIWMTSDKGLTKVNPNSGKTINYGKSYGLEDLNYLTIDRNNNIWVGAYNGFYCFTPDSINPVVLDVKALITSFNIFDKPYKNGKNPDMISDVNLDYTQNFFSFEFSSLDFDSKEQKQYAYMLEGIDEYWTIVNKRKYAGYTNIQGGDYTFKVKSKRADSDWSKNIAKINIHISPPFWKRWWFWFIVALIISSLILYLNKLKINSIRKEEKRKTAFNKKLAEVEMKALRAQMNPHFLFNSLNAIKLYVLKRDKEKAADYLTDFSRLIRMILNNSSEKKIPLSQEIETLNLYVSIEKMRFDESFDFTISIEDKLSIDSFFVPPLLFQPYVENAIWHGLMHKKNGKGLLEICFSKIDKGFRCMIKDNGVGRKAAFAAKSRSAQKRKSKGMKITKSRMDLDMMFSDFYYTVKIEDLYDIKSNALGTKVVIDIVLK